MPGGAAGQGPGCTWEVVGRRAYWVVEAKEVGGYPRSEVKGKPWRNGAACAALVKSPGCRKGNKLCYCRWQESKWWGSPAFSE